ncbi:MAG: hypothetical protein AB7N76_13790 [Planctomycetota bacterium]
MKRSFSLVEVAVASALLALVLVGSAISLDGARQCQVVARERQAALLAAATQIQDLVAIGSQDESSWNALNGVGGWNQTGFAVRLTASGVGANADFSTNTTTSAGSLPPAAATSTLWPAGRPSSVATQPGYIEITDHGTRVGLKVITVTVAWTSAVGGEERVVLSQWLVNPELVP